MAHKNGGDGGGCVILILFALAIVALTQCEDERAKFMTECTKNNAPQDCANAWSKK